MLLGAGATGSESLKNLILPGVGEFTIVDGATVNHVDVLTNFFFRDGDVGRPRAVAACELLCELNCDVKGWSRVAQPEEVLLRETEYVSQFDLVIGAQLSPVALQALGEACWRYAVPLVVARACGLVGSVRIQCAYHPVVEARAEAATWDLRLADPFPTLAAAANDVRMKWATWSAVDRLCVPYVLLLCWQGQVWRETHDGALPLSFDEKCAFKEQVASLGDADNVREALREAYRLWAGPSAAVPDVVRAIATSNDLDLATVCAAIVRIGRCPVAGLLPDMQANTQRFVALQRTYANAAHRDVDAVHAECPHIDRAFVDRVCRHCRDLRLVSTRSLADELESPNISDAIEAAALDTHPVKLTQAPILWYVALRAADRFLLKRQRWPSPLEPSDIHDLTQDCAALAPDVPGLDTWHKHALDIARFADFELHATAAIVAAVAAQEAVKLISRMYIPLDHTFFLNAVDASATILQL